MIFARLKHETREHHKQLEETVDIFSRITSFKAYQELLQTFYGFYKPLESALSCITEIESIDFQARRKVPFLYQDLRHIGVLDSDILQLPQCSQLPVLTTLPEALGCLYVLEGATLGGQIITRALQKESALTLPRRFFESYGADVGQRWKDFQETVEQLIQDSSEQDTLVKTAQETFLKLEQWFQEQHS